jgi:hypothetical protein
LVEPRVDSEVKAVEVREFPSWLLLDAMATLYGLPACGEGESQADWEVAAVPRAVQLIRLALPRAVQ